MLFLLLSVVWNWIPWKRSLNNDDRVSVTAEMSSIGKLEVQLCKRNTLRQMESTWTFLCYFIAYSPQSVCYNPSQSYSGAFLLSFICKSMYTIHCLATKTQKRNLIVPQKFLSLFSLTQRAACIMKYMAVRKFIPFFFRLIALRTSYVTCVSYLYRHMFLKQVMILSGLSRLRGLSIRGFKNELLHYVCSVLVSAHVHD